MVLDIDKHAIWYAKCDRCGQIWLEAGQFSQYKQNFAPKGLVNLAKQVLPIAVTDDHSYYKSDRLPLLLPRIDDKIGLC